MPDSRYDQIQSHPANEVFQVVFFPDRVYHAQYLNATRSPRYRYNVQEVRAKSDAMVLKGEVYLDDAKLTNFLRVEYRSGRLTEAARLKHRLLGDDLMAWVKIWPKGDAPVETMVPIFYCPWVDAYQCEIWESLEVPQGFRHDFKVLDLMGRNGSITSVSAFEKALGNLTAISKVELRFREGGAKYPSGYGITDKDSGWDNFYGRNVQVPNSPQPNDYAANTVPRENYEVDFQRGWYVANVRNIAPVKYRNAMMLDNELNRFAQLFFGGDRQRMDQQNITEMRWVFQQELGGNLVFFHEVTVPPGGVEGTHQHIGSEELYFITEGEGLAYLAENDDPDVAANPAYKTVNLPIFGLDERPMKELPVQPGSIIFTKSGGMHGIRNPDPQNPLRFVAFLYHSC